jgi:hypothetical protein
MLTDVIRVILCAEIGERTIGFHDPELTFVQVQRPLGIHRANKTGVDHSQSLDRLHVLGEDILFGKLDCKERKIQNLPGLVQHVAALFLQQRLGKTTDHAGHRMNGFAAELVQHHFGHLPHFDHPGGQFRVGLDNADHVAHGIVGFRTDDEIGGRQKKEVQQLVLSVRQGLHQLAQLGTGRRGGYAKTVVNGLVGGQVVHPGAYAADTADDTRHFFSRLAFDEFLKTAQRHVIEPGVRHIAAVVQGDADGRVAFDAGNRLNVDHLCHELGLLFI